MNDQFDDETLDGILNNCPENSIVARIIDKWVPWIIDQNRGILPSDTHFVYALANAIATASKIQAIQEYHRILHDIRSEYDNDLHTVDMLDTTQLIAQLTATFDKCRSIRGDITADSYIHLVYIAVHDKVTGMMYDDGNLYPSTRQSKQKRQKLC